MARTQKTATAPVETPALDAEKVADIQNTAASLFSQNSEEHALVNQLLGQAQMADAFGKLRNSSTAHIQGRKTPDRSCCV